MCLFSQSLGSVGSSNCRGFHHMDFSENRLPGYPILRHLLVSNRFPHWNGNLMIFFWHAPLKKLPNIILLASYSLILGVKFPLLNKACYWSLYVWYILKKNNQSVSSIFNNNEIVHIRIEKILLYHIPMNIYLYIHVYMYNYIYIPTSLKFRYLYHYD